MHVLLQVPDLLRLLAASLPLRSAAALASTCRRAYEVLRTLHHATTPHLAHYAAQWQHMNQYAAEFAGALRHLTRPSDPRSRMLAANTRQRIVRVVCERRALLVLDALLFDMRFSTRYCTAYDLRNAVRDIFRCQWPEALALLEERLPALRAAQPVEPTLCATSAEWRLEYGDCHALTNGSMETLRGWDYVRALYYGPSQSLVMRWALDRAVTQHAPLDLEAGAGEGVHSYLPCVECALQAYFCEAIGAGAPLLDEALWVLRARRRWRACTDPCASLWRQPRVHRRACGTMHRRCEVWSGYGLGELMLRAVRSECATETARVLHTLKHLDAECTICEHTLHVISAQRITNLYALFSDVLRRARLHA